MKLEESISLSELFDIYESLLTDLQRVVLKEMLYHDHSPTEIGENSGMTRQAVFDTITKAENKLKEIEGKLTFLKKQKKIKIILEKMNVENFELLKTEILEIL